MGKDAVEMTGSRRDFLTVASAWAAVAAVNGSALAAQQQGEAVPKTSQNRPDGTALLAHNEIFRASAEPVDHSAVGSFQAVVRGTLVTGEGVELHNSTLLPGHEPHPPHRHVHAEFLFMTAGRVDWLIDGVHQPAGAGDVLYAASNVLHGLRNTGSVAASYFVMAIGPNLKTERA